ncbi:MAG: cobalamin biosynthesis protein CbiX [Flavobacteriales bacterium]|jgi:protoheme ferro-lyase|nr:cobalamin biosynthesis protein CbiX [Flavobacteriales bacterium]
MKNLIIMAVLGLFAVGCGTKETDKTTEQGEPKIGVLIVNHGSVAESWRKMLLEVEEHVEDELLAHKKITDVRTAFMEYTEPSIASRMKEFDEEGYDEVVIVPVFLTVSSHYSHDIPVIVGLSSDAKIKAELAKEKIDVYRAKAKVSITPPLDYTSILKKNIARRVNALSKNPQNEGVLLVAYGDEQYNQQWEEMVDAIGKYLKVKTKHEDIAYSWCGHLVRYSTAPTKDGITQLLEYNDNVIVIPVLIANDPYFQNDIIQKAVDEVKTGENVLYVQDAILPDANVDNWVKEIAIETVESL